MRLRALLLALFRHLGTYFELAAAAAVEYRSAWIRRVALALLAAITCMAGCVALWGAGLVALWDTPWRLTYVVTSAVVLLIVSVVAAFAAAAPAAGPLGRVLRTELRRDVELFQQWKNTI
jgi:hypothetical protein